MELRGLGVINVPSGNMRLAAESMERSIRGATRSRGKSHWSAAILEAGGPVKVGVNEPNGYCLSDMSENTHEWCADYYDYNYDRYSPERNPQGPAFGRRRSSRGGSWRHKIKFSRCAARSSTAAELPLFGLRFSPGGYNRVNAFKTFKPVKTFKSFGRGS